MVAGKDVTRVLIAASEFDPFTNIGTLGRVVQNLSAALVKRAAEGNGPDTRELDIRVVIPRYAGIPGQYLDAAMPLIEFDAALGRRVYPCSVYETSFRGVTIYLLSCGHYFDKEQVYSSVADDVERYSCFCNAVLAMLPRIEYIPDIIQCHDWQMSYIPTLYKTSRNRWVSNNNYKTLFVIHSMQYQGICSRYEMLDLLDLPSEYFTPSTLEFYGQANSLKGGLLFSDKLATVSPSHADEIKHAYYGERLEGVIRTRSSEIYGVMCGIDPIAYNPSVDGRIFTKYDAATTTAEKKKNKLHLQKMLGFEQNNEIPAILIIYDELDYDKGVDLIKFVFDDMVSLGVQLVLASRGKSDYHDYFTAKAEQYGDRVAYVCYNSDVWDGEKWTARGDIRVPRGEGPDYGGQEAAGTAALPETRTVITETMMYAGCDMLLRPSRIEPYGEKHLIAMKYGVLPIVRETGGLKDVVKAYDGDTGEGNGFSFFNYNAHDMLYTVNLAVDLFKNNREAWDRLIMSAMGVNVTWDSAALEYIAIYKELGETR